MHVFRRAVALLLMMTLPAYAWAVLGVSEVCPMQAMPMAEMGDIGHACCAPADGENSQPGKAHPCKPGQERKSGNLYDAQLPRLGEHFAASDVVVAATVSAIVARDPGGVWRPPPSPLTPV